MELSLYKFVANGVTNIYLGLRGQTPQVKGKLVKVLDVPSKVKLELLVGASTDLGVVIQLAPELK